LKNRCGSKAPPPGTIKGFELIPMSQVYTGGQEGLESVGYLTQHHCYWTFPKILVNRSLNKQQIRAYMIWDVENSFGASFRECELNAWYWAELTC
jgi:hypothetical protein